MKKTLLVMLLLSVSLSLFAMGAKEIGSDERVVKVISTVEMSHGKSLLVMDENGIEYIYHFSNDTKSTFPVSHYQGGEILAIKDNGIMTMSLPGQTTAVSVRDITIGVKTGAYNFNFPETSQSTVYPGQRAWNAELVDDLTARFSYAYGYDLISSYLNQGLNLRAGYFAKGVIDFWNYVDPFITVDEMNSYLDNYINNVYSAGVQDTIGSVPASIDEINALAKTDDISEMFAYSYGYYISFQLFYSGLDLDALSFVDGAMHALFNDAPLLGETERTNVMNEYSQKMQEEYDKYIAELSANNLQAAEAFLEDNKNQEGVVTTSSGLQYKIMIAQDGPKPTQDSTVTLTYTLKDLYGNTLDQGNNVEFALTNTIPGFKEAVSNMSVGETAIAYVHPNLGYGAQLLETIEPNSLLIFEIELIAIN